MENQPMFLYRISYYYYSLLGFLATTAIALPVSFFTGGFKQTIDKDLLTPVIHPFLRKAPKKPEEDQENTKELETLGKKGLAPKTLSEAVDNNKVEEKNIEK